MEFSLSDEHRAFYDAVLAFARRESGQHPEKLIEADRQGEFQHELWKKMGAFGLLGLPFPQALGGQGADMLMTVLAMEAFQRGCLDAGTSLSWGAHTILCGVPIWKLGTEEQQQKYLPKIASGEWIGGFALSEPNSGSDAASLRTRAEKVDGGYVLNGTKMWITNGPQGDLFVVIASTDRSKKHKGITAFLVEKSLDGFGVGRELDKMGNRTSPTAELIFNNVQVPEENRLGNEGEGFTVVTREILEWERACLLAAPVGGIEAVLDTCVKYATERVQFERPIADFQAIQFKLADMRVALEAAKLLVYRVAWMKEKGLPAMMEACMAKLFVSEAAVRVAEEAVQIHGGYGYIKEFPVERFFRDAKLYTIGAGTSEVQRMQIARLTLGLGRDESLGLV